MSFNQDAFLSNSKVINNAGIFQISFDKVVFWKKKKKKKAEKPEM